MTASTLPDGLPPNIRCPECNHWLGIERTDSGEFNCAHCKHRWPAPVQAIAPAEPTPASEVDTSRRCDACGSHPLKSWDHWQCMLSFDPDGGCDGKIVPVEPAAQPTPGEAYPEPNNLAEVIAYINSNTLLMALLEEHALLPAQTEGKPLEVGRMAAMARMHWLNSFSQRKMKAAERRAAAAESNAAVWSGQLQESRKQLTAAEAERDRLRRALDRASSMLKNSDIYTDEEIGRAATEFYGMAHDSALTAAPGGEGRSDKEEGTA